MYITLPEHTLFVATIAQSFSPNSARDGRQVCHPAADFSMTKMQEENFFFFVLCQEHNTDINYQCWLHWHPFQAFAILDKLSHGSVIILGFLPTISR
jgi:hypothetical protein